MNELCLCYDQKRWPEAQRVAQRRGTVVLNPNSGRGSVASEVRRWDEFGKRLRRLGGVTLGYENIRTEGGWRKKDATIIKACEAWLKAGHNGIWLDCALDTEEDADLVNDVALLNLSAEIIANPGTRVRGPLKSADAWLCESETNKAINYNSTVVIAFVKDKTAAKKARDTAASIGVRWLAIEPLSTYHVPGVEYQQPNPFTP